MAFNGKEGDLITLKEGADMTAAYREANPGATKGHFFGKDVLLEILNQTDCMGIRIYYGQDEDGVKQLVIVGANASENDILDKIADRSAPCPTQCGSGNGLNGNV